MKIVIFLVLLVVLSIVIPNNVLAQSDADLKYFGKGIVIGDHFTNGIIWTGINGDQSTVIAQWDLGRSKIISDISPSSDCESNYQICVDATVTSSDNSAAVKVGDKFQIKIDTVNKNQIIIGTFGFLENVMIDVDTTKSYEKTTSLSAQEAQSIAEDAYIFGYPLILMDLTAKKMSNVAEVGPQTAPVNQFAHFPEFPTPDFTDVVKPNADTLYSIAWLNLSNEPLVLHLPDTDDRFYLMPMLDAYTNVFESPGKRTTGTGENNFVITGPFWDGTLPDDVTEIQSPTELVWILGRTQVNGVSDFEYVNELQKQYTLIPLSSFGKSYQPPQTVDVDSSIDMETAPVTKIEGVDVNIYFNRMASLMKTNSPASDDADLVAKFAKIGLIPGEKFDSSNLDPTIIDAIELGAKDGLEKIKSNRANVGIQENGWQKATDLGSYGTNYLLRASVAFLGLGANLPEDAIYPMTYVDSDGDTLNGNNKYVIHFPKDQTPPVNAFWSLTMYNMAELFVENPIDLYAIGDRNELEYNTDGSLDIYIQHESPEGHESNWLPAPEDDFNLTLRFYWPSSEIIDSTWQIPPLQKLE